VKSVQVRVAPVSVSEGENGTSGLVAVSGTTRLWRLWSNSMRRSLLSICGLEEESAETGELLGCAALVGLGLDAKDRIRSAAVITASMRRRVGGVFMGGRIANDSIYFCFIGIVKGICANLRVST
jgi:hypothetical protein